MNFHIKTKFSQLVIMLKSTWTENYDQDLKKNVKIIIKVHYLFIKTKISTRHK
jgi:hypothetical protein